MRNDDVLKTVSGMARSRVMPRNCRDKEGDEEIKKDFSTQFLSGGLEMKTFFSTFLLQYYNCGGETTKRRWS